MFQKTLTIVLAFTALFCFGYGITGFAGLDSSSLCLDDLDCEYSACCPLHDSDYGVCAQKAECSRLYFDSKDNVAQAPEVSDLAERSYIAVVVGVIILMILAIVGYFEWKHEKKGKRKVRKK